MADYSCYLTFDNTMLPTVSRTGFGNSYGYWVSDPPSAVAGNTCSRRAQLSDKAGPAGSTGWVNYALPCGTVFGMSFDDPYIGDNSVGTSLSGPNKSNYSLSYRAKTDDGSWHNNSCPSGGHPLYVEFTFKQHMPRRPDSSEISFLTSVFPDLDINDVLVLAPVSIRYNCIAWSLGIDYTWINPPSALASFQTLYNTAANSSHGDNWRAHNNWQTQPALTGSAEVDGWGTSSSSMTHGSRYLLSADFPAGAWTSKLGQNLLITHGRQGLRGSVYGNVLTSFVRSPTRLEIATLKTQHEEMTDPEFFSDDEKIRIRSDIETVSKDQKTEFEAAYQAWLNAIDEKLALSSDTRDGAALPEFGVLVEMGERIVPLLIELMARNPRENFRALVVYDALIDEPTMKVAYSDDDAHLFEGEPARAARTVKMWLNRP